MNKVNALPESPTEVAERMMMIERLGGVLKYATLRPRVPLQLADDRLHFPRMLAEMVRLMHLDGITRISELTERHQGDESVEDKGRVDKQAPLLRVQDEAVPAGTCPRHAPCQNL